MRTSILSSALFCALSNALAFDAPAPTPAANPPDEAGWSPKPTEPPVLRPELMRRDYQLPVLVAPDNNCGYFDKSYSSLYDCDYDATCKIFLSLFTSGTSTYGGVGCCDTATCGAYSECIDYAGYYTASSRCTTHCTYCTDDYYAYCNRATFVGLNVQDFYCGSKQLSKVQSIYTTYNDAVSVRVYTTSYITLDGNGGVAAASSSAGSLAVVSASSGSLAAASAGASGNSTSSSTQSSKATTGLPLGVVIGAAVGGVVVLALVITGIVLCVKRRKNKAPTPYQAPPMTTGAAQGGPNGASGSTGAQPGARTSWIPGKGTAQTQAYEFHGSPTEETSQSYPPNAYSPTQSQYQYQTPAPSYYAAAPMKTDYQSPPQSSPQQYYQGQYNAPMQPQYQLSPQVPNGATSPSPSKVSMNVSPHSAYAVAVPYPVAAEVDGHSSGMQRPAGGPPSHNYPVYEVQG